MEVMAQESETKRTRFSLGLSFWTEEDIFALEADELLAILSSEQTDVHYRFGNIRVFNRIILV